MQINKTLMLLLLLLMLVICIIILYYRKTSTCKQHEKIILNKKSIFLKDEPVNYFKNKKVIITGLVRNSDKTLYNSILFLYGQLIPYFKEYKILVYESDSTDKSRDILLEQNKRDDKFIVMCGNDVKENLIKCDLSLKETENRNTTATRINKMVMLRNMYINEIKKDKYKDYDYVIVYDFDLNPLLKINSILSTSVYFEKNKNIDAICANGIDTLSNHYYDIYAYESNGQKSKYTIEDRNKYLLRNDKTGLEKVNSCFGGMTIYRRKPFISSTYYTYKKEEKNNGVTCEHTGFHDSLNIYNNYDLVLLIDNNIFNEPINNKPKPVKANTGLLKILHEDQNNNSHEYSNENPYENPYENSHEDPYENPYEDQDEIQCEDQDENIWEDQDEIRCEDQDENIWEVLNENLWEVLNVNL